MAKQGRFFGKAGEIFWQSRGGFFGKAEKFLWKSREIFFGKAGKFLWKGREIFFGKAGEISVPNLTFEREEEVKGINFGGQTFARP